MIVTQSSMKSWLRCRKAYDYKYIQLLRPRALSRPLTFGSVVHKVIEYRLTGRTVEAAIQDANKDRALLFASEVDLWDQIMIDVKLVTDGYLQFYKSDKTKFKEVNGKQAEHKFSFPLIKGVELQGKIDCFPRTPDGRIWVGEHKTRSGRIENDSVRTRDLQTMIYARVATTALGIKKVAGVWWDYIRSKSPTKPELTKSGNLSKSKIDTLPSVFLDTVKEHKLNPADYADVIKTLEENQQSWFRRVKLPINQGAIDQLMEQSADIAREIRHKAGSDVTRNLTRDCSWCSYEKLCTAELLGMDADFIREREYRRDDQAHSELQDVEPD